MIGGPAARISIAAVLALALSVPTAGQDASAGSPLPAADPFSLQPAFPNPFATETRIPFILGEQLFRDRSEVEVTLRVYNLLHQPVSVPRLRLGGARRGRPVERLRLREPGSYEAVWDGTDGDGDPVTPGPYFVQLSVGDRTQVRKLLLTR